MLQMTPADVILDVLYVDIVPYMLIYSKPVFVTNTVDPDPYELLFPVLEPPLAQDLVSNLLGSFLLKLASAGGS